MEKIDYQKLYVLQDEVLGFVNSQKNDFYLTGGTALNRFIFNENTRYSDDLDFFISGSCASEKSPQEQIKEIVSFLKTKFDVKMESSYDDFQRIVVSDGETKLQVDFVNDTVKRFGESIEINGYKIDNPNNILSNKISAIMSRDEEKDIYDLYLLSKNIDIDWENIILEAQEKEHFQSSDFVTRLKMFPVSLLDNIKTEEPTFLEEIKSNFKNLIFDIQNYQNKVKISLEVEGMADEQRKSAMDEIADTDVQLNLKQKEEVMSTNNYVLLKAPFMKEFKKQNKRQFKKFLKKETLKSGVK